MHLEVFQGLQKIDSYQQDMFLPEEIDFQLNKQQDRFLEQLTNQKFQDKQIRADYIKNVIVKNKTLPVYVPRTEDPNFEQNVVYAVLPSDYLHLVSDRSDLIYDKTCKDIVYTPPVTNETIQVLEFLTGEQDPTTNSYYTGLTITATVPGNPPLTVYASRFDVDSLDSSQGSKINDPDQYSIIVKDILDNINLGNAGSKQQVYWEYYRGQYFPRSFIFVTAAGTTFTITEDDPATGNVKQTLTSTTETIPVQLINEAAVLADPNRIPNPVRETIENKLSEGDELYEFRKNVYYKPSRYEPHSALSQDYLYIYREASYILTAVTIDYIRKPRQISLLLNQGCELAGSAPRLIVDATVEYFKLIIENPSYQGILQDNQIRNQNTLTNG